jgi:hypothetical protein
MPPISARAAGRVTRLLAACAWRRHSDEAETPPLPPLAPAHNVRGPDDLHAGARPAQLIARRSARDVRRNRYRSASLTRLTACEKADTYKYKVLPGPGKLLHWSVSPRRGHDDLLISTGLTARLDEIDWRDRTARNFVSRRRESRDIARNVRNRRRPACRSAGGELPDGPLRRSGPPSTGAARRG